MATAVVCDDDRVLRSAVSARCEEMGLHVMAETDRGADAVELARRFRVDVVILDVSLVDGSGELCLRELREMANPPAVVAFTAYARAPEQLVAHGAYSVVEKPDLDRLIAVLSALAAPPLGISAASEEDDGPAAERRGTTREVARAPELWRSPSGISASYDLVHAVACTKGGDAVLVVSVEEAHSLADEVGSLLATDCRLAVGRLFRETLRVQDLLHEAPDVRGYVAVLRGGDTRAASAAWARLIERVHADAVPVLLSGAWRRVDELGAYDAIERAAGALRAGTPAHDRLVAV